jgi:hypothetical protein
MFASIVAAFVLAGGLMGPQPSVEDLDWLVGDRVQRSAAQEVREVWIGPGAGVLLGMSLTRRLDGGKGEYEHMRIDTLPDGRLAFIAMPSGQAEAVFPLKSYENRRAVFEDPDHDFPQRVIYWDKGNGVVGARIEGKVRGKDRSVEWTYSPTSQG